MNLAAIESRLRRMLGRSGFALRLLCLVAGGRLCADEVRPPEWARYISSVEVPNFYQLTPLLYRSGQPFSDGFRELEKLGVRTVISLVDGEGDEARAAGTKLRLVRVPVPLTGITDDAVVAVLRATAKKEDGPFLVHCLLGADRTGAVIAMHRILIEGWTREAAIREMREGGYGFGIEVFTKYVEGADLAKLRARLQEK